MEWNQQKLLSPVEGRQELDVFWCAVESWNLLTLMSRDDSERLAGDNLSTYQVKYTGQ